MTDTEAKLRAGIPEKEYERLESEIESSESPVGIDARKAHVLILYKLEQMEKRLSVLETEGKSEGEGTAERASAASAARGNGGDPSTDVIRRHADEIERLLDRASFAERTWPDAVAMTTDIVDEEISHLQQEGVDVEERLMALRALAIQATDPEVLEALGTLADAAPALAGMARMAQQLPDFAAMGVDIFDETYRNLEAKGIEPEAAVRRGLEAALRLSQVVSATKLDEVEALFSSTVLDPETLQLISKMGQALVESRKEVPERIGLFGLLGATRDREVQLAAGFLVQFARRLGANLKE